ncbi:spore germination protein [Bacillus taeanensis]|nr:spore germination protein [Bacillus taeanensis]
MPLFSKYKRSKSKKLNKQNELLQEQINNEQQINLYSDISKNYQRLKLIYETCNDVIFRNLFIEGKEAFLVYIEGLSNIEELDDNVLRVIMKQSISGISNSTNILKENLPLSNVQRVRTFSECIEQVSLGNPVIILDNQNFGLSFGLSKWEKRSIEESVAEPVVRGPREGFIEVLQVNTSLLRRKIRSPNLKMYSMELGRYTKTKVMIAFIEGIVDNTLIEEIKSRLGSAVRSGKC